MPNKIIYGQKEKNSMKKNFKEEKDSKAIINGYNYGSIIIGLKKEVSDI